MVCRSAFFPSVDELAKNFLESLLPGTAISPIVTSVGSLPVFEQSLEVFLLVAVQDVVQLIESLFVLVVVPGVFALLRRTLALAFAGAVIPKLSVVALL